MTEDGQVLRTFLKEACPPLSQVIEEGECGFYLLFNSTKISEKEAEKMKDELQLNHEKLLESMKEHGYRFGISHDMGDGLGQYWDMIIPVAKWKEESFVSLWRQLDAQVKLTTKKLEKAGFTF